MTILPFLYFLLGLVLGAATFNVYVVSKLNTSHLYRKGIREYVALLDARDEITLATVREHIHGKS
jgi:hypothetical protein